MLKGKIRYVLYTILIILLTMYIFQKKDVHDVNLMDRI